MNRLTEAPRDNFKLGGNFSYFTFCFTGNLTMTNFLHYPQLLAVNMFSKVPRGDYKRGFNKVLFKKILEDYFFKKFFTHIPEIIGTV